MRNFLLTLILFATTVTAKEITPFLKIDVGAIAKDITLEAEDKLVIGTAASELKVYNYKDKRFVKSIKVPKIKDFMGDIIDTRISSVTTLMGSIFCLAIVE